MPIIQENGRWRSVRTHDERKGAASSAVANLSDKERLALHKILQQMNLGGHSPLAQDVAEIEWEEQPIPVADWLGSVDHVGETGQDMYPQLRQDMVDLFEGNYHEAILTGAIGWGKDFFATTCCLRMLYELNCLKNPQHTLGLAAGEPIHIVPISKTVSQARRVVFGGVCKKLNLAKWFNGRYEETMEEVRFRKKGIYIVGGASQDAAALGLNVIFAIVDESNFLGEGKVATGSASGKAEDKATMIYNALARRVKSRYRRHGVNGLIMLVSSKRSTEDFTERRIRQAVRDNDTGIFVRDYAVWNVHPEPFEGQKWYRVAVSPKAGRCRLLEDPKEEAPEDGLVFEFPEDYLDEFRNDPDGATRDIAGVATDFAGQLFMTNRRAVDEMFDQSRPSPFKVHEWSTGRVLGIRWDQILHTDAKGDQVPVCCASSLRHVHIDMSTNHCATGVCIGHRAGAVEVWRRDPDTGEKRREEAPVIHIDGILRIVAPDGGDIDHGEVRGLIYRLISEGLPIRSVSMDQYMGPPNLQMFSRRGLRTEEVGERKAKMKPYLTLRQALYEGRVVCHHHPVLEAELKALEMDGMRKKVIHPPRGSKDLADALAGVVYWITERTRGGGPLYPEKVTTPKDYRTAGPAWSEGEVIWPDEELDTDRRETGSSDGATYSWIIRG